MRIPVVRGVIDRRILVNYRVDPEVLSHQVPAPFRPVVVHGWGMAGICLIRLRTVRPRWLPGFLGIRSENAAHRIAVEWDDRGVRREGVYIPRRDTSSWLNVLAGGRLFPGMHHHSRFHVAEQNGRYLIHLRSDDGATEVSLDGRQASALPAASIFGSLAEASDFFARGALGYSVTAEPGVLDGLELRSLTWKVEPLAIAAVHSSFFDDRRVFPAGSIAFDCALLMQNIDHEWHGRESLCCSTTQPFSDNSVRISREAAVPMK